MKKIITTAAIIALLFTCSIIVHAENAVLSTVEVVLDITDSPGNTNSSAQFRLSDGTKNYDATVAFTPDNTTATATFQVSQFQPGKIFKLSIVSGLESVQYYDTVYAKGKQVDLQTYTYLNDGIPTHVSTFHLHAIPTLYKPVEFYRDFIPMNIYPAPRYYDGVLYVPASEGAKSMGVSYIEYDHLNGAITYWILKSPIKMQVGSSTATAFGSTFELEREVMVFNEIPYIPLLSFAEMVEANVIIQNEPDHVNAVVSFSEAVNRELRNAAANEYIYNSDLSSETEYLIWVSKANYTVRVYKGAQGNWTLIKDIPCSVGKLYTPTCTGTFRYYERVARWPYAKYYVGPIMRFNGGYAIHTTLIKYDGTPYDDRVGMNISAGCVRVQPKDMEWLINLIPMYTTIHITDF